METAIKELLRKKQELKAEQKRNWDEFEKQISDLDTAIETLSGKKVWELAKEERYDDESPIYIKGSHEEM